MSGDRWTAKRSDAQQSALFDVCMGEIVSSLKAVDQQRFEVDRVYMHSADPERRGSDWWGVIDVEGVVVETFRTPEMALHRCEVLNHG